MRWVLLLLLVANLTAFGWWQGWFADRTPPPQELQPQRLRVVPLGRLGSPSTTPLRQTTPEASRPQPTSPAAPLSPTPADRNANAGATQ